LIKTALQAPKGTLGETNVVAALERCGQLLGGEIPGRTRSVLLATDGVPETSADPTLADFETIAGAIRFLGNTRVYVFAVENGDPSIQAKWEAAGATYIPISSLTGTDLQGAIQTVFTREAFA
jgi:hypothetical protein